MVWTIEVAVKRKRVCSKSTGLFPLQPDQLWELLACTESRPVFRVERRQQLSFKDGVIVERVVFVAPVRILFWKKWAHTEVQQTVDLSDPTNVTVNFHLIRSDMMSHLTGSWRFQQLEAPHQGTHVTYCFEMWPKGVPAALRFMPGLLDAVKTAVSREAAQLLDKLAFVAHKVRPGRSLLDAAREASAEVEAAGGSFKCLQLLQSGNAAAAAAAAAAEAAARQEIKGVEQHELLPQQVLCHALDDVSSESEDDCVVAFTASTVTSCSSSLTADSSCDNTPRGSVYSCSSSTSTAPMAALA